MEIAYQLMNRLMTTLVTLDEAGSLLNAAVGAQNLMSVN